MATDTVLQASRGPFDLEAATARVDEISNELRAATSLDQAVACVLQWDELRKSQADWSSAISIRFRQVTNDPATKAAKARLDDSAPQLEGTRRPFLEALFSEDVTDGIRSGLAERFGETCMLRWRSELRAFHPSVGALLAEEQRLKSQHTALIGGGRVTLWGKEMTLSAAAAFLTSPDRGLRKAAAEARWGWFSSVRDELDEIFDGQASEHYVKHIVQDWSREPYIQGSYSQRKANAERLAEPVAGRLYFAGEAMNPNGKTIAVHGACESAYIAVEAMLA